MSLAGRRSGRRHRRRRPSLVFTATIVAMAGLALAACGGQDEVIGVPGTTTTARADPATTTTSAPADPEEVVTARYLAFWDARLAAVADGSPDPDHPDLREYATGAQLENVITEAREWAEQGIALRWPEDSVYDRRVRLVSLDEDVAVLQDCAVNDAIVYRIDTGEVVDDAVVTRSLEATMQHVEGAWKLAGTRVLQSWEGVAGCALAEG